jgi:hypothetical protein
MKIVINKKEIAFNSKNMSVCFYFCMINVLRVKVRMLGE